MLSALALLVLPALQPLWVDGLTASFDGRTHLLRLGALQRAVASGVYLPRWLPEMQLGYGYPVFNYYPPGAYYLALIPSLFGMELHRAYALGFTVAALFAGCGAAMLARDVLQATTVWQPMVAGLAYMYAPYVLLTVYIRGSLPETVAQALLPWILWSGRRILTQQQPTGHLLLLVAFLSSLALSHSLTLLLTAPYLTAYLLVVWWRGGRSSRSLRWIVLALLISMGVSAFIWLPILGDRQYLSQAAVDTARFGWLPSNVWKWDNFLDVHVPYEYNFARPVQLGIAQMIIACIGFFLARRFDGEWLFFAISATLAMTATGAWTLPIWQSSDVLAVIQFPWRLLTLVSLSLALLSTGWLTPLPAGWPQAAAAGGVIAVLIFAQRPQVADIPRYSPATMRFDPPMLAQVELAKGVLTDDPSTSVEEFRPRWAGDGLLLDTSPELQPASTIEITDLQASPVELSMQVNAPTTTTLRFQDFYFPGWEIVGEHGSALTPYPSTNLGLLTVDMPPGQYRVHKLWHDPPFADLGAFVSLATLACLAVICLLDRRLRRWSILPTMLLAAGISAFVHTPAATAVYRPQSALDFLGVRMLGYRVDSVESDAILIYPYWYVTAPPPSDLRFRWQLRDAFGTVVQEAVQRPFFNTMSAANWPPGTIVDDALQISLPEGAATGNYQLAVGLEAGDEGEQSIPPVVLGDLLIEAAEIPLAPSQSVNARLGESVELLGANYGVDDDWSVSVDSAPLVLMPGQDLSVRLYWQTLESLPIELHSFVHLVDAAGNVVARQDQTPGPDFQPSALWLPGNTVLDEFRLHIPASAMSAVVWPTVGLYDAETIERLPVLDENAGGGDAVQLKPVKVISHDSTVMSNEADVQFGDLAELDGFEVDIPETGLRPGDQFTVTLAFRSLSPTTANLTRFVHVHNQELGMAAQSDGLPQNGMNPTWSWVQGERIVDRVALEVGPGTPPGRYALGIGFYDPESGGARLPVLDRHGNLLVNSIAPLMEIVVVPR